MTDGQKLSVDLSWLLQFQLQKQTRQSLKCIIGERDLFYFVHKKRYNRLEYMQRIASITAGMVIHSNYPPEGEKEHFTNSKYK